jgi:hypothetical protein
MRHPKGLVAPTSLGTWCCDGDDGRPRSKAFLRRAGGGACHADRGQWWRGGARAVPARRRRDREVGAAGRVPGPPPGDRCVSGLPGLPDGGADRAGLPGRGRPGRQRRRTRGSARRAGPTGVAGARPLRAVPAHGHLAAPGAGAVAPAGWTAGPGWTRVTSRRLVRRPGGRVPKPHPGSARRRRRPSVAGGARRPGGGCGAAQPHRAWSPAGPHPRRRRRDRASRARAGRRRDRARHRRADPAVPGRCPGPRGAADAGSGIGRAAGHRAAAGGHAPGGRRRGGHHGPAPAAVRRCRP